MVVTVLISKNSIRNCKKVLRLLVNFTDEHNTKRRANSAFYRLLKPSSSVSGRGTLCNRVFPAIPAGINTFIQMLDISLNNADSYEVVMKITYAGWKITYAGWPTGGGETQTM